MKIQKRGLPNQEETPINIESPKNNEEPKEEPKVEETKPKREKKKKKEPKKIERPTLYTYTVSGCVKNSKGRFKFTDIIEAQDESIASDIYKQRAKKEFSAVRAVNKIEVNKFKEGDIKETEKIEEELKYSEPIKIEDILPNDEELTKLILSIILTINGCKIYRVVYAPSKKKSRLRKAPKLYYMAKDIDDMKHKLETEIREQLGEYNEKWVQSVSVLENILSEEIIKTGVYKSIYRRIINLDSEAKKELKEIFDKVQKLTTETISDKEKIMDVISDIPKILLSNDDEKIVAQVIGDLEIKSNKKSVELESIDNGLMVKNTGYTDSILGNKYALHIENKDGKLIEIRPAVSAIINPSLFKIYTVHCEKNGIKIVENCKVLAESEDKASDYMIFICRKMELIKKNDTVKTDIFLDEKQVAGYICRV